MSGFPLGVPLEAVKKGGPRSPRKEQRQTKTSTWNCFREPRTKCTNWLRGVLVFLQTDPQKDLKKKGNISNRPPKGPQEEREHRTKLSFLGSPHKPLGVPASKQPPPNATLRRLHLLKSPGRKKSEKRRRRNKQ